MRCNRFRHCSNGLVLVARLDGGIDCDRNSRLTVFQVGPLILRRKLIQHGLNYMRKLAIFPPLWAVAILELGCESAGIAVCQHLRTSEIVETAPAIAMLADFWSL